MNTWVPTGFGHRITTRPPPAAVLAPLEQISTFIGSLRRHVEHILARSSGRAHLVESRDQRAARFDQEQARLAREHAAERRLRLIVPPH